MRTLIVLSALPGSGKSTWSEQYRLTNKHVKIVSSDAIRKELTGQYQDLTHEKEVWEIYFNRINEIFDKYDDVTVIADSTNITNNFRLIPLEKCPNYDRCVLVVLKKKLDKILEQNLVRNKAKYVPEEVIKSMWKRWEDPTDEVKSVFDEVIEINGWFESPKVKESFHYKD